MIFETGLKKTLILFFTFFLVFTISFTTWAEPYYFRPKMISEISKEVDKIRDFQKKIVYLNDSYDRINNIQNNDKNLILSDIQIFKKNLIYTNFRTYVATKYFKWDSAILKEGKKIYQIQKIKDLTVDIHPNYIEKIEQKLKINLELDEKSNDFKLFAYILSVYLKNKNKIIETTNSKLSQIGNFSKSSEYLNNIWYYEKFFTKLLTFENINPLSKDDFERIYSKILRENISPSSDYMKWFFAWYAKYTKILSSDYLLIDNWIKHTKQAYSLSCEANSAKDLANYINNKYTQREIIEDDILNTLPSYTWWLMRTESWELLWQDPNKLFIWDIKWRQSSNPNKFSWYWVYADPIIQALKIHTNSQVSFIKTTVSEDKIISSIINEKPLMFWYLTPVKKWKGYWYQYTPITWKTFDWGVVNWYIWEHTWILVGYDISRKWKIENIYFYEWRTIWLQKMSYEMFIHTTSFFNQMIVYTLK